MVLNLKSTHGRTRSWPHARRRPLFVALLGLPVAWAFILLIPGAAVADHDNVPGNSCYDCHTLSPTQGEVGTDHINMAARTLPSMRALNRGTAPEVFGCTFCHNDPARTGTMLDAFQVFLFRPSQHPVDRGYGKDAYTNITLGPNTYTTIYMANWDNSWAGKPANQIGCVDCHDATNTGPNKGDGPGGYPEHPAMDNADRIANPRMLRGGASSWDNGHATNSFCLSVCHGSTAPGPAAWKMGHLGWGAFDNTLKEPGGTPLLTSVCTDCHESHSTSQFNRPNLLGEQRQAALNIIPSNCTGACHDNTAYNTVGHGTRNVLCTQCHDSSVSHRAAGNPKRFFPGKEDPAKASLTQNFSANGRDDDFDGLIDDTGAGGEDALRYSATSNCSTGSCHANKHIHQGTIGSASGSASCLHCHEPHGKGIDNNIRMVRRTVMGKETRYGSRSDYFRADNTSICDNPNCHAKPLGSITTSGTILGDVQEHIEANVGVGYNCTGCHSHSSTTGGSSFAPACNGCHDYPGQQHLTGAQALSSVHARHIGTLPSGNYAFPCSTCHYKYNHNQSGVTNVGNWDNLFQAAYVNIKFEGSWNPRFTSGPTSYPRYNDQPADNTLAGYAEGNGGTGVCAGLYCHGGNATVASWPVGTDNTPTWNAPSSGACGSCHRARPATPPQSYAHPKHADNTTAGYAIPCSDCHHETTADGVTIASPAAHVNRQSRVSFDTTKALLASGSYTGTTTVGDSDNTVGSCSNLYCHSPGNKAAPPFDDGALAVDWTQAGPLSCNACHGQAGQTGISVGMPAYANGAPKANAHPAHLKDKFGCQVCHWATTRTGGTIYSKAVHVNGLYDVVNDNLSRHAFTGSGSPTTCSAAVCHAGHTSGAGLLPVWGEGPYDCSVCHAYTGGALATADVNQYVYGNGMAKINFIQWSSEGSGGSGHGRTSAYASGNPGAGSRFGTCTANCHSALVGHDNALNPFRLRSYAGISDFSDTGTDPANQQNDNKICLDCHGTAPGGNPIKATKVVEENHYEAKHSASGRGGTFCWDCHDPHGDANHYMVHDNVSKSTDGVFGIPATVGLVTFSKTNLNGETAYNGIYDWGDYVDNAGGTPYTGVCQACHSDPGTAPGETTGGAAYFSSTRFAPAHNKQAGVQGSRCTSCHAHSKDFKGSCGGCHGTTGTNNWPDNTAPGAAYPDRAGAHQKHVNAIGTGDSSCTTCHPGNPPVGHASDNVSGINQAEVNRMDTDNDNVPNYWTTNYFKNAAGATDGNGFYRTADRACSNIDCHGGTTTPNWYYTSDTAPPAWSAGMGVQASDNQTGGGLNVRWRRATDAYPSSPVRYDLYRSTVNGASAVYAPDNLILANLLDNQALVTGLSNGTTYYFGVRAKDSWSPPNVTTDNTVSAGAVPSGTPPGPVGKVYYLNKPAANTLLWGSTYTNLSLTCGTVTMNLPVYAAPGGTSWPPVLPNPLLPPAGRGLLTTSRTCGTASASNYMGSGTTSWYNNWRLFAGFYTAPYAVATTVTGSATGNTFGFRSYLNSDDVRILFAAVDNAGNHTVNAAQFVERLSIFTLMTAYSLDLSSLSATVPAGSRLALLIYYFDTSTIGSTNHQIAYDNFGGTITNQISVTETPYDNTAPVFSPGPGSGIAVTNPGAGGMLNLSWSPAADAFPSNPVKYDLYRSTSLPTLWSAPYRSNLGVTSIQDTGLTNGIRYYYGVHAKDSMPTPNVTTNIDNASAVPTQGGEACAMCHGLPPTTDARNAGSHAKHARTGVITDCDKCHPGASSYTNGHQDGTGQLGFTGTPYNATYNGNSLTYANGPTTYYSDTNGYGILTGSAGDNTDNGTCSNTGCHGTAQPVWGNPASVTCGSCHSGTVNPNPAAPLVGAASAHVDPDRAGGVPAGTCTACHPGHSGGVAVPLPPSSWDDPSGRLLWTNMRTRLGIPYTSTGGIHLGGTSTTGSTEAEICWNCHSAQTPLVSEWGFNTKTSPATYPVAMTNFPTPPGETGDTGSGHVGWIYLSNYSTKTSDWVAGYWMDAYDNLIKRRIASVHSASFDTSGQSSSVTFNVRANGMVERSFPTLEEKPYIRCSYCHDVHDLNRASGPPADTSTGKPFLRGSWVSNPYPPELPPRGLSYPRQYVTAQGKGGYFLDQNSNWPTNNPAMNTLNLTAGLCTLCHDSNVDTMKFYTGSSLWRAGMVNGHSNSTLGGSIKAPGIASDLFTGARGGGGMGEQIIVGGSACLDPNDRYWCTGGCGCSCQVYNDGWYSGVNPQYVGSCTGFDGDYSNWYGVGTIGGAQGVNSQAHKFTCSKCHTPHAAGLPALLVHNCIDTGLANLAPPPVDFRGLSGAADYRAVNCHRKTSTSDGWHKLAPGQ